MKKIIVNLAVSLALVSFVSCQQNEEEALEPDFSPVTESITEAPEGGQYEIQYTLSNPVEGVEVKATSAEDWIDGFVYEDSKVLLDVAPNTTDSSREGIVSLTYGTIGFDIPVTQHAPQAVEELPGDAGEIEGNENPAKGEKVTLSIAEIDGATMYRWYLDGEEVQLSESRELTVFSSGVYTVAGVNDVGEGGPSPEKTISFDENRYMFYDAEASYEGGDFNKAYHVILSTQTGENEVTGIKIIFYHESPEDPDNIVLPSMTYKSLWPYLNDYTAVGTVAPNDLYSFNGSCIYVERDGVPVDEETIYFKNDGGNVVVERDNNGVYTITGSVECIDKEENSCGIKEFEWTGTLDFENNWKEYNTYYFEEDNLEEDMDLGTVGAVSALYYWGLYWGNDGHMWHFELWSSGGDMSKPSYDIITDFYTPASDGNKLPVGTFRIAEDPKVGEPWTADRGYYYNGYSGTKLQYWDGTNYTFHVLAQPKDESYIKIEDNGNGTYTVTVLIFDSLEHEITANYTGALSIIDQTSSPTKMSSSRYYRNRVD